MLTELANLERSIVDLTANIERDDQRIAELEALLPALESDEQAEADAARARGELRGEMEIAGGRARLAPQGSRGRQRRTCTSVTQLLERRLDETERRLAADAEARVAAEGQRVHDRA